MARSGWEALGETLGGAGHATYEKAYNEGRFRSAQTEDALTQARINQAKAIDQELQTKQKTEILANPDALMNPNGATLAQLLVGDLGANYQAASTGMQTQQGIRFRDQVANTGTSAEQRLRSLQAIEGKPSADVVAVGANDYVNLADELQVPEILDSAQAKIDAGGEGTPAMKNFNFANTLPPDQRRQFEPFVRNDVMVTPGGVPTNTGFGGRGAPAPVVDPGTVATNIGNNAQAKAEGTQLGNQVAAAPGKIDKAEGLLTNIDALLNDAAFDTVYGLSNVLDPRNYIPGTDASRATGLLKTIDAQTFGLAIEQMKGLGALSNAEGLKVQQAFTEATNPNLDEVDARAAWQKVKTRLEKAVVKARTLQQSAILPQNGAPPAAAAPAASGPPPGFQLMEDANGNQAYVGPNGEIQEL